MKNMKLAMCAVGMLAGSALAQDHGDVLLSIAGGRIQTGAIYEDGSVNTDVRVFQATFGEVAPNFTDEPGFDNELGTFPTGTAIGFRVRAALRVWDGSAFAAIPGERIEIAFASLGPVTTPLADGVAEGFTISVGGNGQWHRHLEYTLTDPAGPGVYLMELSLFSTAAEVGESRPFWFVFGQNALDADMDAASAWVEANKLCPADFNRDGFLDFFDYGDFVGCFETSVCEGDRNPDFNGDGFVDFFDYGDFVGAFEVGCA